MRSFFRSFPENSCWGQLAAVFVVFFSLTALSPAYANTWCGRAPFCDGSCVDGETSTQTSTSGDGDKCLTGHKVYCTNATHTGTDSCSKGWLDILSEAGGNSCNGDEADCGSEIDDGIASLHTEALKLGAPSTAASPFVVSWKPMHAGDCVMQNASVAFHSDGYAIVTAQVKTNHTHSGDIWHATISAQDANGKTLFTSPTLNTFRMDDNHPWYNWRAIFRTDYKDFSKIRAAKMKHSC